MRSARFFLFCVLVLAWAFPALSQTSSTTAAFATATCGKPVCTWNAFGPQTFTRETGSPAMLTASFPIRNPNTQYTMVVQNNGISSAVISLNGVEVFGPSDFNPNVATLQKSVSLQLSNTLSVELRSKPSANLTITVIGVDTDPPGITYAANPLPNQNGWNNSNVTLSFSCADNTSGVASCSPPTTLTSDGLNQMVSGKAVDLAGNSATVSVSVNIDKTPPTITASVSPAPNAAGWNNSNVTVTFSCADALSGVAQCPAPVVVSAEGANQVISGTSTDKAGNTATTSVTLNIDKTPPTITATPSPAPNAKGWNNSDVTVSFKCADSLSGITTCPAPVTVSTEGANQVISGTATDVAGNTASASVTINLDKTPPAISITSPANGATFTSSSVSVTGSVSDALSGLSTLTCNGAAASVQNGSFDCSVTLTAGTNTITAQATDVAGNASSSSVNVTFSNAPPPVITSFSPPSGPVGSLVTLTGSNFTGGGGSTPQVTLSQQGGGNIPAPITSFTATSIAFVIPAGAASGAVTVTVGAQTATSSSTLTIQAASSFTLSAAPGSANLIQGQTITYAVTLNSTNGFSQLAALSVSGLPSGVTATFSLQQITAGQTALLTVTAPAGQATGTASLTISAAATVQGIPQTETASVTLNVQPVTTSFLGRTVVQDPNQTPLAGVTITVLGVDGNGNATGCSGRTVSDAGGNFMITNLPSACVGSQLIQYDGSTATSPPGKYAGVNLLYTFVAGQVTTPPVLIHLPRIDIGETKLVQQNASVDQTFSFSTVPGLSVTVYAGTKFTLADGTQPNPFPLIAVQVPVDRLPDVMPQNSSTVGAFIVAFQPANTVASQPVAVTFPNTLNTPPGVQMELDTLNPTLGALVKYGTGTVSSSATQIIPDADPAHPGHRYGLVHFDWHGPRAPGPNAVNPSSDPNGPKSGDPVDPASGLLVVTKTDMSFGGSRGTVAITRTYRTMSGTPGPFGIGTNHNYGYLLDTFNLVRGTGTFVNLILPDGNQLPFAQQGANTFVNSTIPSLLGAVITSPSSGTYNLRWKNGTVFQFASPNAFAPVAFLNSITDSNGNVVRLGRGNPSQPIQITQIIDPVGRALNLTYDNFNRILSITDPIGRTVQYAYNSQGTLASVTDANGGVTSYTYDTQNRMASITDPRGVTYLQNGYNSDGRVVRQVAADGGVTTFAYTLLNPTVSTFIASGASSGPGNGGVAIIGAGTIPNVNTSPVLLCTVTDPLGHQTTYHFNPQGFLMDVTDALGQKTVYTRDLGTNQLLSVTDPLGRAMAFAYDSAGNQASITRLAGTPNAVTTSFTYDPSFNKVTSITDPLGHATTFKYDGAGNLLSVTDPLNEQVNLTYDGNGELLNTTDPLGYVMRFAYANGDLIRTTDSLGRATSRVTDAAGRSVSLNNPLGQTTRYAFDNLNQPTGIIDPSGKQTNFTYDGNGNLLTLSDANQHTTTYAYDSSDRLTTRTDPLGHTESYQYDLNGNLTQFTDRRGVVTTYSHDSLDRPIQINFGGQSSINYSYDSAGRLSQAVDSITGSITRSYDGFDRLASEVTPQGRVDYGYDLAGRRTGMSLDGQAGVGYSYDDANRLTQIRQGNSAVSFVYDVGGRRISLTLPNGVVTTYSYDAASQLTGLTYANGPSTLGNLTYNYDLAGRRTSTGGSFARSGVPQPLANASYGASNQLTQFGASNLTYDENGNLTSDGVNTYTWDARNHLVSISGKIAANFQYDPFGRRVSKTIAGTTQYLYDGANPVQELSGSTASANLLAGSVDEYFQRNDASGANYSLTDALGSAIALADTTGAVQTSYTYDPFGNTTSTGAATTNSFQYTERENDGTGLYYYRARYYNPLLQRFISEDPSEFAGGDTNLYAYVENSVINSWDPFGLTTWPTNYPTVTSPFGAVDPIRNGRIHTGVDIRNPLDGDAIASDSGTIIAFRHNPNFGGDQIVVLNDDGSISGYSHTAHDPDLSVGDHVNEGDIIGSSNGSGNVHPHLHYTYRRCRSCPQIDPLTHLRPTPPVLPAPMSGRKVGGGYQ